MAILSLARAWYAVVGIGALALTGGHLTAALSGSRLDVAMASVGLVIGVLSLLAAAWVSSIGPGRVVISWAGIVAGALPFLGLLRIALTTAQDAIVLAAVPTVIALAAAAVLARARAGARTG